MNQERDPKQPQFQFNPNSNRFALIFLFALITLFIISFFFSSQNTGLEIPYSTFLSYLEEGRVDSVTILDQFEIRGTLQSRDGERTLFTTKIPYYDDMLMRELREKGVRVSGDVKGVSPLRIVLELIPWIIGFLFIWFMFRQMQVGGNKAFSFGKSRARQYQDGKKVMFADVAGQEEAKNELQEVVEFLKNPHKFTRMGARIPKGVLLVGMPGTGKTLLARAVAGEAGVPFFHMSGSDFVEMFVGVGAARVRDLFDQGRKHAPCIIFIDELDAVGRVRGAGYGGGHDEREQTLNQLLVEMDGFESKEGVIVLAATNRPDVLDPALLRPGRFDRQVVVDMPDVKEREAILRIHARKVPLGEDVDFERIARGTAGTSGADLENLVNEAALLAARKNKGVVEMEDFEEARDKILMGVARKSRVLSREEKEKTAYHESGHALLHFLLEHVDPLHKVTIVPRGRALGMAVSLPEKDEYSKSKSWLMDRIKVAFGGYAAEKIVYNETTTGAKEDIRQATEIARRMVCEWGMSETLGPVALGQEEEPIFIGKEIARHKDYSEETARKIDEEIRNILTSALNEVMNLLGEHKEKLDVLARTLIERETLTEEDICELLNMRPRRVPGEA
ncbi:ATP-dependent metalloprotease FtsH [Spirochaeta thermophila DSM 6578]|uniref:ATP-dependent zinc metalloprotease FtsH n=1 Tax=Winmispira thermophila (strain ATCC 700085 / DSM 6578 / Z-1203) TaxID=869211 RepID=G0GDJ5_WINT7|nr:ATP-dependent zinc metalloprotease FtsH [Spirochaeta thermophila]AEJ61342.1 ATP-dependent metalloprotease FtsH [Spirochaeta thermophila DSM 6578]